MSGKIMKLFFLALLPFYLCYGTGERLLDERVAKIFFDKQYQITSIKRAGLEYCLNYEQLRRKSLSKEAQKSFFPYEYNRFELYLPFDKLVAIKAYKQYVDSYLQWIKGLSQDDFYKHFKKLPNFNNRFEICMDMYDSIQYQSEMQKIIKKYCKKCE